MLSTDQGLRLRLSPSCVDQFHSSDDEERRTFPTYEYAAVGMLGQNRLLYLFMYVVLPSQHWLLRAHTDSSVAKKTGFGPV